MASPYVKQAPQMMSALAPDLQEQQMELSRQQQLADMLRQQGSTPIQQQVAGGHVVKISPWEGLAKMLTAGVGGYMQSRNDKKQAELGAEMAKRQADALRNLLNPGAPVTDSSNVTLTSEPQANRPQSAPDVAKTNRTNQLIAALKIDPQLGSKLIENELSLTNDEKNWRAQGIDPREVGQAEMGKLKAAGLVNASPNSTLFNAGTNQPVFTAADFSKGTAGGYDANGAPIMSRIAGSEVLPKIAGEIKAAETAATTPYSLTTVTKKGGPELMTVEQAIKEASGGGSGGGQIKFTGSNGTSLDFNDKTPGQVLDAIGKIKEQDARQQMMQTFGEWMQNGNKTGGIPLQSDAEREKQVGAVRVQNAVDEALAKSLPQERKDKQTALAKGESALALIDKALTHPGMKTATGLQGTLDPRNYIPGTNAKDFQVVMDQLNGQTFLQAMESLRHTGQITEIEGKKASDAIARLNRSQSTEEFQQALKDFKDVIRGGMERIRGGQDDIDVARDKLAAPRNPSIPTIADIDAELARRKKGK